ncbi:hypothetical protein Tco_1345423 [Tanacetum coccineum]
MPPLRKPNVFEDDFQNYVKANDAVLRNMQNQNLQNQMTNLTDMLSKFVNSNTASTSGSGTLPTIPLLTPKKKLSLLELTPTCMTLELSDRSISQPIVVDFDVDPRVPLILGRSFLKTGRALIDVYEGELTLRVENKNRNDSNLDQTSRYSSNYDDNSVNRIDVIEMSCEEYSQEVLGFSYVIASGSPTPCYDSIVSTSSPTLISFGDSDFLLEEVDAFLDLEMIHLPEKKVL